MHDPLRSLPSLSTEILVLGLVTLFSGCKPRPSSDGPAPSTIRAEDSESSLELLYSSALLPEPENPQFSNKDVAAAIQTLIDAQRDRRLPRTFVDARSLVIGSSWIGGHERQNRIANIKKSDTPDAK